MAFMSVTELKRFFVTGAVLLMVLGAASAALAANVTVSIEGVRTGDGALYVSLQTEDQFMQDGGAYGRIVQEPGEGALTVTITDVVDGEYSVSVWHDFNGNNEFDRNDYGMPLDGWSMLGAETMSGPPSFEDAKFSVSGDKEIVLEMMYPAE